jgi:hypothetical protein
MHQLHHPRIETTLVLRNDSRTVEIANRIEKAPVRSKAAAYIAFPFRMDPPRSRYATQNGFVDPDRDLLPGPAANGSASRIGWPSNRRQRNPLVTGRRPPGHAR